MNRQKKEWLKEQIDKLDTNEHTQIHNIITKYTKTITKTPTGYFVSSDDLTEECLKEIENYTIFCLDQRKRMEEDMKERKTYERLIE
jgi:hypothetical protein